ncbi:Radical SAM domain protein [Oceanithermus profundus DSM 14977]|uniref:Aminodeoxyfutalosine synthase n=1 Tax=Oceanithermus profundus (strain DSM 14977 / NBRC 100410 / VKM B-2274 / 506) TaxID=670487 RepID=E4U8T3_OCEP5|nr:Radical SAM domain protein [Oceanithermus profundus DSM 14977]
MGDVSKVLDPALEPIAAKVAAGERLSFDEGLALYKTRDLNTLMRLADHVRRKKHGDRTYFVHSLRFSQTNICYVGCPFCAFAKRFGEEGAWDWSVEESVAWVQERYEPGLTEIHIASGHHPRKPFGYYLELVAALKENFPGVQVKAWTAAEIHHFAKIARSDYRTVLSELKAAGLDAMPGGGAEIFAERVRRQIAKNKVNAEGWLEVHRTAHALGLPTNATMLYGHIETLEERLDHMDRLRRLQDETGGFMSFIPLAFQPLGNNLAQNLGKTEFTTGLDDLRNLAIARIYLDNFPHIKGYWATLTAPLAQVSLDWGVSDIDGTLIAESIVNAAGATSGRAMTKEELARIVRRAGRLPVERDALYNVVRVYDAVA